MSYTNSCSPHYVSQSSCGSPYSTSDASSLNYNSPNHSSGSDEDLSPTGGEIFVIPCLQQLERHSPHLFDAPIFPTSIDSKKQKPKLGSVMGQTERDLKKKICTSKPGCTCLACFRRWPFKGVDALKKDLLRGQCTFSFAESSELEFDVRKLDEAASKTENVSPHSMSGSDCTGLVVHNQDHHSSIADESSKYGMSYSRCTKGDTTFVSMKGETKDLAVLTSSEVGLYVHKVPADQESGMQEYLREQYFRERTSASIIINATKPKDTSPEQPDYGIRNVSQPLPSSPFQQDDEMPVDSGHVHERISSSPISPEIAASVGPFVSSSPSGAAMPIATASTDSYLARIEKVRNKYPDLDLDMPTLKIDLTRTATPYSDATQSKKPAKNGHVKRPMNAFMVWAQQKRRAIIANNPDCHNAKISEGLGQEWRNTDQEIKDLFAEEAMRLREFHAIEFPNYKYRPRKNKTKEGMRTESGRVTKPKQRDLVKKSISSKSGNSRRSTTSSAKTPASALTAQPGGSNDNRGAVAVYQLQPPVQKRAKSNNGGTGRVRRKDRRQSSSKMVPKSLEAESPTVTIQQLDNNNTANILTPVPTTGGQTGESAVTVNTVFPTNPVNPYYNQTFPLEQPVTFTPAVKQESVTPMDTQDNSTSEEHPPFQATSNFSTMSSSELLATASIDDFEDLRVIDTKGMENLYDPDLQTSSIQLYGEDLTHGFDLRLCDLDNVSDADVQNVPAELPEKMFSEGFF